jgi:hypothetical protein
MAFATPVSSKLANSRQQQVHLFYTDVHEHRKINVKSRERNPFKPLDKVWLSPHRFARNSQLLTASRGIILYRIYPYQPRNSFTPEVNYAIGVARGVGRVVRPLREAESEEIIFFAQKIKEIK